MMGGFITPTKAIHRYKYTRGTRWFPRASRTHVGVLPRAGHEVAFAFDDGPIALWTWRRRPTEYGFP